VGRSLPRGGLAAVGRADRLSGRVRRPRGVLVVVCFLSAGGFCLRGILGRRDAARTATRRLSERGTSCKPSQDPRGTESDLARRPTGLDKGDASPLPLGIINNPLMEQNSPFVYLMSDLSFLMI
jgi:hypothetical protein